MNSPAPIENPFGKAPVMASNNAIAQSDSERAIQEVQAAMIIAKRFPRNTIDAMDRILNACTRPTLAESALYSYPRGGQDVTGPSIRLAEALAQNWGNMQFGIRELSAETGVSTVEAFAWDMETNTRQVKVFQVAHTRYSRSAGVTKLTDPRDIYEMIANQGARRLRSCILGVIPGDVTEKAVEQCMVTQHSNIDTSPEAIKKMLSVFERHFKVTKELIEKRLGKRVEAIQPAQMQQLLNIAQSMRDRMSAPSDWFDVEAVVETVGPATSDLNEAVKAKTPAKGSKKPEPEPEPEELPLAAQSDFDDIMLKMVEVTALDDLNTLREAAMEFILDLPEAQQKQITELYSKRKAELE